MLRFAQRSGTMKSGALFQKVPCLMIGSLLLAIIAALAHHIFNTKIDQRFVRSEQQLFSGIGTGLAFLVKTLLTASAGLAYTQLLWYSLRAKPFYISGLDAFFAITHDVWQFSNREAWESGFHLVLIALIVWTIPIVAVFTPGTISIQLAIEPREGIWDLPIPSINYDNYTRFTQYGDTAAEYTYVGPSDTVSRLMTAVTSQGSILPISAPLIDPRRALNSSYSLEFFAPSLYCEPITTVDKVPLLDFTSYTKSNAVYLYVGFVRAPYGNNSNSTATSTLQGLKNSMAMSPDMGTLDLFSDDYARLYIILPPLHYSDLNDNAENDKSSLECGVYNSSFHVDFSFNNPEQAIHIRNKTKLDGGVVGNATSNDRSQRSHWLHSNAGRAYTGMLDALSTQLVGSIFQTNDGLKHNGTQIHNSIFMQTQEMQQARYELHKESMGTYGEIPLTIANMSLAEAVEQVFDNATLSLFSDPYFLQDKSTANKVPVHMFTPQNKYVYAPRNLVVAYSSSIAVTAIVVLVGLICISRSDFDALDTSFSTILRTTRNPELDALVAPSGPGCTESISAVRLRLTKGRGATGDGESGKGEDKAGTMMRFTVAHAGERMQTKDELAEGTGERTGTSATDSDSLLMPNERPGQ